MNFKKLGIVLFLLIAVAGFSMSSVCAGGEGDTVGEPNTLAIAFINTFHSGGVWVNGIHYLCNLYPMTWAANIHVQEFNKDNIVIVDKDQTYTVTSSDFIERFTSETTYVKVTLNSYTSVHSFTFPADGSHYGGVCFNSLFSDANFRIVGNHFDTGWHKF